MKHIMLDIETLDNKSNAAILSIGAVAFDMHGNVGKTFYRKIKLQSCLNAGLTISADTLKWWVSQSKEALQEVFEGHSYYLSEALMDFTSFLDTVSGDRIGTTMKDLYIWGNSNRFDCGIIENAFTALGVDIPWNFRNERDMRTFVAIDPEIKENEEFIGIKHNPVHDAVHQVKIVTKIAKKHGLTRLN